LICILSQTTAQILPTGSKKAIQSKNYTFSSTLRKLLPSGSSTFTNITLNGVFGPAVHWDGQYITLNDAYPHNNVINRVQVSDSAVTVIGTTTLNRPGPLRGIYGDYWIQGATIIKTGWSSGLWNYPKGGRPVERYFPNRTQPHLGGVTVSVASSR
jgi:hypothetical protein